MPPHRVLVTGIGLVTALGRGREETWQAIRSARSAARWLDLDPDGKSVRHAGFPILPTEHGPRDLVLSAATEAMTDAGLGPPTAFDRNRAASIVGLSKGDVSGLMQMHESIKNPDSSSPPLSWTDLWPDTLSSLLSLRFDLRGPSLAPIAACATGVVAALRGANLIREGACDLALVGAADASLNPLVLGAFRNMKALARVHDDPKQAFRPWCRDRSGFLVGEGAAILVLERETHARARGATAYAELLGGALGCDAHHLVDLDPDPTTLADLIRIALERSEASASDIDHINVHGTATRVNDPLECLAIRRALGPHADTICLSANKPQIGHLLGAAGAAELALTCLAIRDDFAPPTLNLDDPDPLCDLNGTPHIGKNRRIRAAIKLSLGFGGHLSAVVLGKPDGTGRKAPT